MEENKEPYAIVLQFTDPQKFEIEDPRTWADDVMVYYREDGKLKNEVISKQDIIDEKTKRAQIKFSRVESLEGYLKSKYPYIYLIQEGKSVKIDDDISK